MTLSTMLVVMVARWGPVCPLRDAVTTGIVGKPPERKLSEYEHLRSGGFRVPGSPSVILYIVVGYSCSLLYGCGAPAAGSAAPTAIETGHPLHCAVSGMRSVTGVQPGRVGSASRMAIEMQCPAHPVIASSRKNNTGGEVDPKLAGHCIAAIALQRTRVAPRIVTDPLDRETHSRNSAAYSEAAPLRCELHLCRLQDYRSYIAPWLTNANVSSTSGLFGRTRYVDRVVLLQMALRRR